MDQRGNKMINAAIEVIELIKKYHQTCNELEKSKIAHLIIERLSEIDKNAEESNIVLPSWFPEIIFAYRSYHKARTGLDKLKWKAFIEDLLETIDQDEGQ